jgi:hypothetical protein
MKLIITVDTEADNQWKGSGTALRNLDDLPRFQSFVESHGYRPTYLASYETLEHPTLSSFAKLHAEGRAELGGHLHPWATPPFDEEDAKVQRFPSELSSHALQEKLKTLTEKLSALIGDTPYSFRAGKWGFDGKVAEALYALGYRADSSVTPGVSWKRIIKNPQLHASVPDFSKEDILPTRKWHPELLEIPMTVLPTNPLARLLGRSRWCRIFPDTTGEDLKSVYSAARRMRLPALVFMTHSSELMPGGSPYAKDAVAVERTYEILGSYLDFLRSEGVEATLMREFAESYILTQKP